MSYYEGMDGEQEIATAALKAALTAAGSQSALARICGCTQGAVWQMLNRPAPRLSVDYVLKVEAALAIPRHMLRPDIYPLAAKAA